MKLSGKVLKAAVILGRDVTELELRLALTDGKWDRNAPTSSYVGQLGEVHLTEVPAEFWDDMPAESLDSRLAPERLAATMEAAAKREAEEAREAKQAAKEPPPAEEPASEPPHEEPPPVRVRRRKRKTEIEATVPEPEDWAESTPDSETPADEDITKER